MVFVQVQILPRVLDLIFNRLEKATNLKTYRPLTTRSFLLQPNVKIHHIKLAIITMIDVC